MSVINQVLRDLDARGAVDQAERYNLWSPDRGRQAQDVRFFPYPGARTGHVSHRSLPNDDSPWRRMMVSLLIGLLLLMLLATPWLPHLVERNPVPTMDRIASTSHVPSPEGAASSMRTTRTVAETTGRTGAAEATAVGTPTRSASAPVAVTHTALAIDNVAPPSAGVPRTRSPNRVPVATQTAARLASTASPVSLTSPPTPASTVSPAEPTTLGKVEKTLSPLSRAQQAQLSYAKAVDSVQAGRPVQALGHAQEALRQQPTHQPARHLAAILLHDAGHADQAADLLREGLNLAPQTESLTLLLARMQSSQGQLQAALNTLDQPPLHSLEADTLRAGLWSQLRQYKQAAAAYEAALQKQPGQVTLWLGLAVALDGDGQANAARQAFTRVQALGLSDPELRAFVAQRLRALE